MKILIIFFIVFFSLLPMHALEFKLEGGNKQSHELIKSTLAYKRLAILENKEGTLFWTRRLSRDGATALQALGYYEAKIEAAYLDEENSISLKISHGPVTLISSLSIEAPAPAVNAITNPMSVGDQLKHQSYEKVKQEVHAWLLSNGYLQAKLITHCIEVNKKNKSADIKLAWETGPLNYANTALDNPSLEFYASREIDDITVGVRVTGRPNALVSRLESNPSMCEADILNYLVLGKAPGAASEAESTQLANAAIALALARSQAGMQDVGGMAGLADLSLTQELGGLALSLGKQLSPRLYIGYTMGFAEPINVAKVCYLLGSKWVIESEIAEETRAIIKYRFEKD